MIQYFLRMMRFLLIFCVLSVFSCQDKYEKDIVEWRADRLKELKDPYGWPSVIGLFHMRNTYAFFGRTDKNDFIIPNAPSSFGILKKTDTAIVMTSYKSVPVVVDGQIQQVAPLFSDTHPKGPTMAYYENFQWHIIERDSQHYLRVKDTLSQYRQALTEIPYFPIDKKYIVSAKKITPLDRPTEVSYQNILGQNITNPVAAYLSFDWKGEQYELTALENDDETYFLMIHDGTTGISTYGGGRYLYPNKSDSLGNVILDFNKLINPPCVFTPYATCPLPPKSNHLPFDIESGEKDLHLY